MMINAEAVKAEELRQARLEDISIITAIEKLSQGFSAVGEHKSTPSMVAGAYVVLNSPAWQIPLSEMNDESAVVVMFLMSSRFRDTILSVNPDLQEIWLP